MELNSEFASVIDTCSMINLSLYLEACEGAELDLGSPSREVMEKLRKKSGSNNSIFEEAYIKSGERVLDYLKSHSDWDIYFSIISKSEMYRTLSERLFDELLTKAGIPFRIRKNKTARTEIRFDYEQEIIGRFTKLQKRLEESEIILIVPESIDDIFQNVYDYLNAVASTISLDVFDSYIYAVSIRVSARELYSNDKEFVTIVNNIYHPPSNDWKQISIKLNQKIANLHPFKDLESSDLPPSLFPQGKP